MPPGDNCITVIGNMRKNLAKIARVGRHTDPFELIASIRSPTGK